MMDPKMDSGLKSDEPIWDVNTELDPYKILGLMDKVFAAEVTINNFSTLTNWKDVLAIRIFFITDCIYKYIYSKIIGA